MNFANLPPMDRSAKRQINQIWQPPHRTPLVADMRMHPSRRPPALHMIAWLSALALVYINLIPFDYRPVPLDEAVANFRHLAWFQLDIDDRARWVSNLLQFAPFGFFTSRALGRRNRFTGAVATGILGTALAVGIEFAQIWAAPRTVSFDDIAAETIGAWTGAVVWAGWGKQLVGAYRIAIAGGPESIRAALYLYIAAYAFIFLNPFDFLISPHEINDRLRDPNAIVWFPLSHLGIRWFANLILKLLLMVPFGAGVKFAWNGQRSMAVIGAIALSWSIEIGHWFELSAVMNLSNIALAGTGAALGHRLAGSLRIWRFNPRLVFRAAWLAIPVYLLALMVLRDWRPGVAKAGDIESVLATLHWIPFYYHYFAPSNQAAFTSALAQSASFAPVGVLIWAIRSARRGCQLWAEPVMPTAIAAAGLAAVIEAGRVITAGLRPDPTNILIAAAAALFAQRFCEWASRVLATAWHSKSARP